jgi:hypothetical protein
VDRTEPPPAAFSQRVKRLRSGICLLHTRIAPHIHHGTAPGSAYEAVNRPVPRRSSEKSRPGKLFGVAAGQQTATYTCPVHQGVTCIAASTPTGSGRPIPSPSPIAPDAPGLHQPSFQVLRPFTTSVSACTLDTSWPTPDLDCHVVAILGTTAGSSSSRRFPDALHCLSQAGLRSSLARLHRTAGAHMHQQPSHTGTPAASAARSICAWALLPSL